MKHPDPLSLEITSDPQELPRVRDALHEWCGERAWTPQQVAEVVLAVDEALTNVMRHGYAGQTNGPIHLTFATIQDPQEGEGLEICVRDFGRQVDPTQIRGRDLEDYRPGGLGVHIIRALTCSAEYSCPDGGGMMLVMRKFRYHTSETPAPPPESA